MQGQLRKEELTYTIQTECAHCGEAMQIEMDSQLNYLVTPPGANPRLFVPMVDFNKLEEPSIIDAF